MRRQTTIQRISVLEGAVGNAVLPPADQLPDALYLQNLLVAAGRPADGALAALYDRALQEMGTFPLLAGETMALAEFYRRDSPEMETPTFYDDDEW